MGNPHMIEVSSDIESDDNDDAIIGTDVMPLLYAILILIRRRRFFHSYFFVSKSKKRRKRDEIIGHVDNMMITFFLVVLANSWILT